MTMIVSDTGRDQIETTNSRTAKRRAKKKSADDLKPLVKEHWLATSGHSCFHV